MNTVSLNKNKIEIAFDFDWSIVDVIKEIPGRKFNPEKKTWTLPDTEWHRVQVSEILKPMGFEVDPTLLETKSNISLDKLDYPKGLRPFQKEGVDFLFRTSGRAVIADDMGLGKTIEALAYISMACGRTLVIAPTNVIYKWEAESNKWLPEKSTQVIDKGKSPILDADITIIPYGLMGTKLDELSILPFNAVVFDEAHYLKNPKAQRTRVAKKLLKDYVPHILFLSGTPFTNRPLELFPMLNMLDPIMFNNFVHFARRYAGAVYEMGHWYFPDVATNTEELADILKRYMLRRTSQEVLKDLPELTRTFMPVEISNRGEYREAVKDITTWLKKQDRTALNPNHVLTRLNTLRQVMGLGKVDAAIELAENVLQNGKQVVLFAHHKEVVDQLASALESHGVRLITGDTPAKERLENSNLFLMKDSPVRVMIISVAGAEGIDLYSASNIIFVEREWNPAKEEQAEKRLHRMGQENAVSAYYLVARRTVDEKLHNIVERKRKVFGQILKVDDIVQEILEELT